jgi:amidohydrolase
MQHLKNSIQQLAKANHAQIIDIRRHIHAHPELSFQEYKTAAFIATTLQGYGLPVQSQVANTGLVVQIEGRNPAKRVLALRADIDALPIQEANEVPYKSTVDGVMHACGHDVHAASLIGTAIILDKVKDAFEGTIKLIFQPAEEKSPGGAIGMIQAGVLQNPAPAIILAQHVSNDLPVGKIGFAKGPVMANTNELYITVYGKGGHAACPHTAVDPILIAAHIIVALQQIVSRQTDPITPCVLSICNIAAGAAINAIPEVAYLAGTVRTSNEACRKKVKQQITLLAQSIAAGMGGSCEVTILEGYPATYNDPALTERMMQAAGEYMGVAQVQSVDMCMAGEDFAYFAKEIPGCFYFLGIQNKSLGIDSNIHTPTFNIDEEALAIAPGLMAWLAIHELQNC